eukprot:TRINITY_DN12161_c0_g1_i3.p1 TRINITY_DN12161_c0_g1~~TRINITY_DN12161_c0_g1_i3.p1  ORF type:complete len:107 (+),score=22.39 TRINITY_DN12161_c0_g1_i3:60-380(+)
MSRPILLPATFCGLVALLVLYSAASFVQPPATVESSQQRRFLQATAVSSGAALASALPALAEEIDVGEEYNRKVLNAAGYCLGLAAFLVGFIISQAKKSVENRWLD